MIVNAKKVSISCENTIKEGVDHSILTFFFVCTALKLRPVLATKDGSTVRWYGTPRFLLRSTVRLFCNGTRTVRWYGTPFL